MNSTGERLAGLELTKTKWDFKSTTEILGQRTCFRHLFAYGLTVADLGGLRNIVAILFGPEGIDDIVDGWEGMSGTQARDIGYWDAVAALNTRTELDHLDGVGATDRRDAFLRAALMDLGK